MNQILPAAMDYQNKLLSNISITKQTGIEDDSLNVKIDIYKKVSAGIKGIVETVKDNQDKIDNADSLNETRKTAIAYYDDVKASVEQLRDNVDLLENWVDDENWPLPKYRELLFVR